MNAKSNLYDNLDDNFSYAYAPAVRKGDTTSGRASGGLAIFWRNNESASYFPIKFTERILGLKIVISGVTYLLLNVYCPCDYGDTQSLLN